VRGDFLEPFDPLHAQDAGVLVDAQGVVRGPADLLAVTQSDNEHNVVLSWPRARTIRCRAGPIVRLWHERAVTMPLKCAVSCTEGVEQERSQTGVARALIG